MNVPSVFELNSIKDQLSLLAALSSHIDLESYEDKEIDPDFDQLLRKMDNTTKNLGEKFKHLKSLLEN